MARELPKAVRARVEAAAQPTVPSDKLDRIREAAEYARAHKVRKEDLEQQLELVSADLTKAVTETLPELMGAVGLTSFTVAARGNEPAFEIKVKPFYRASIPVDWPEEKREAAFAHLEERDAGDLIKTVVSFEFPKELHFLVGDFVNLVSKLTIDDQTGKYTPPAAFVRNTVHHATLSSWLKEEMQLSIKMGKELPKLDVIGGMSGRVAEIKDKESK